jgi:hypothetical protein
MRANFLVDSGLWQDEVAQWNFPAFKDPFARLTIDYTDALVAWRTSSPAAAREALARGESDLQQAMDWLAKHKTAGSEELDAPNILVGQLGAAFFAHRGLLMSLPR